jgi:hypothetical protein
VSGTGSGEDAQGLASAFLHRRGCPLPVLHPCPPPLSPRPRPARQTAMGVARMLLPGGESRDPSVASSVKRAASPRSGATERGRMDAEKGRFARRSTSRRGWSSGSDGLSASLFGGTRAGMAAAAAVPALSDGAPAERRGAGATGRGFSSLFGCVQGQGSEPVTKVMERRRPRVQPPPSAVLRKERVARNPAVGDGRMQGGCCFVPLIRRSTAGRAPT